MTILQVTPQTWTITLVGYLVVFLALVALIFVFSMVPKILQMRVAAKLKRQGKMDKDAKPHPIQVSGNENAAIAMALHLYFNEMHDDESNVITIKKIQRRYSPWSSKIHSMNNTLDRR